MLYLWMKVLSLKAMAGGVPKNYYKYLIDNIGLDFLFIFVSDDPDWIERNFNYLPNKIFLKIMRKLLTCLSYLNASKIFYQEVLFLDGPHCLINFQIRKNMHQNFL